MSSEPVHIKRVFIYFVCLPKEEFKLEVIEFKASRTSAAVLYVYVATFCSSGCKLLQIHNASHRILAAAYYDTV